ncbi:MAG TPA: diaminopimelate decarboxylase [Patescibacteria group bacterium]|nr:diaminopimelate decarboxylase [Patescibacteria group bacterium]
MTTTIAYKNSRLFMEDVDLTAVAEKFGTPLYCYSAGQIAENYDAYRRALKSVTDDFTICYAAKANSNLAVLKLLQSKGAGADIVSGGELKRALAAGISPKKIVYSGVGKSDAELAFAIRTGIMQINVESEPELEAISRIAKKLKKTADVSIRVNPNVDAKTHAKITTGKKENKFGIDIDLAPPLYKRALKLPNIRAIGVAVHIGSQLTSLAPYKRAYERVAELVIALRKQGNDIRRVDLGGGIGITYRDETPIDLYLYALMVRDVILPLNVHIVVEPGRFIVGDAGVLLSRVVSIKQGHDKKFLILDAAMNDLMRPSLYDAYHAVKPLKKGGRPTLYDIVGPVCETGDTFHIDETLPQVNTGDLVAIMTAGAYGAVMSSNYNTRPLAGEAIVQGKKFGLARKPQTAEDLVKNDLVPGWLA